MNEIPLFKSYYEPSSIDAVVRVIERSAFWADGPEIEDFEAQLAVHCGTSHALAFNSGTSALLSLLLSVDVRGKQVVCPSFTFVATAGAIELAGGIPVFADVESESFGLDAADVARHLGPSTGALLAVSYGGCVLRDALELADLAAAHGVPYLEDAAQAFGATVHGQPAGSYADAAAFSFCQNKVITALGEGGGLVTNSAELAERAALLRSHGRIDAEGPAPAGSSGDKDTFFPGYNFRMASASAAFASSQLAYLTGILERRRAHAARYAEGLRGLDAVALPEAPAGHTHCYQMYTIRLADQPTKRALAQHLADKGVQTCTYFEPLHWKAGYRRRFSRSHLPTTEKLAETVLTLPLYVSMTEAEIGAICHELRSFLRARGAPAAT